jgi:hypothetical protein
VQPPFIDFTLRHAQQLVAPTRADLLLIDVHAEPGNRHSRRTGAAHVMYRRTSSVHRPAYRFSRTPRRARRTETHPGEQIASHRSIAAGYSRPHIHQQDDEQGKSSRRRREEAGANHGSEGHLPQSLHGGWRLGRGTTRTSPWCPPACSPPAGVVSHANEACPR